MTNIQSLLNSYLRLGRFNSLFGAFLLVLPSFWSIALNAQEWTNYVVYYYIIFFVGALCMRAFGCVINDYADKDFDQHVERTKNRPLVSGEVTSSQALIFAGSLLIVPAIIWFTFDSFAKIISLLGLLLAVIYPFTKRFFFSPQLVLGIAFNWGVILADAVINNAISLQTIILYLISIIWTIAYDTVYAYQDYKDDKKLPIKSTTMLLKDNPMAFIFIIYTLFISGLIIIGIINLGTHYFAILLIAVLYIYWCLFNLDYGNPQSCNTFFKQNVYFALILWLAMMMG